MPDSTKEREALNLALKRPYTPSLTEYSELCAALAEVIEFHGIDNPISIAAIEQALGHAFKCGGKGSDLIGLATEVFL